MGPLATKLADGSDIAKHRPPKNPSRGYRNGLFAPVGNPYVVDLCDATSPEQEDRKPAVAVSVAVKPSAQGKDKTRIQERLWT